MKFYNLPKLYELNFRMQVHEGNAKERLQSEAHTISMIHEDEVPIRFKAKFEELLKLIEEFYARPLSKQRSLRSIQNRTATKYLKLLIDIEDEVRNEESDQE